MNTTSLTVNSDSPKLFIRSGKNCSLVVRGRDIEDVQVSGKGAKTLEWEDRHETFHLRIRRDATVEVPRQSRVDLEDCRGHVDVSELPEGVTGGAIGGHARLGSLGSVALKDIGGHCSVARVEQDVSTGSVGGHLNAEAIGGDLSTPNVGGHARGRDIKGRMLLGNVGGHIEFQDINSMDGLNAGGHAKLKLSVLRDSDYSVNAGGNIALNLPVDAGATVHMSSGIGNSVQVFGDGSANFQLNAGGMISLSTGHRPGANSEAKAASGGPGPIENIAQQVRRHIEQVIETATNRLTSVMDEQGLTSDKRADLQEQFTEIQEEAVKAAQEAMETVQTRSRTVWEEEVKPNLDFLTREAEPVQTPPVSPEAQAKERMMILRMLEEGKISVEEANQLLQALGT
ncbi:MAG: hypothetical protein F4Y37_10305 [Caldilineaceae bacterium SB0664_bin_22]|nr:hypothetical protein [Caldilineaceae bacterium SB0664_bin_22]